MVIPKASSLPFLFAAMFATLSFSSALYPSQVNSLSAAQMTAATSAASASTLSASATSSSSATTQSSSSLTDSKNAKTSSSATMVTVTVVLSASFRDTFSLPKSNFDLVQKIFKLKKLSNPDVYAAEGCHEYDAVRVALLYFSRDKDKAKSWLYEYMDDTENLDADDAKERWNYLLDKINLFGEEIGDPYLEKYPRLQQFCEILLLGIC